MKTQKLLNTLVDCGHDPSTAMNTCFMLLYGKPLFDQLTITRESLFSYMRRSPLKGDNFSEVKRLLSLEDFSVKTLNQLESNLIKQNIIICHDNYTKQSIAKISKGYLYSSFNNAILGIRHAVLYQDVGLSTMSTTYSLECIASCFVNAHAFVKHEKSSCQMSPLSYRSMVFFDQEYRNVHCRFWKSVAKLISFNKELVKKIDVDINEVVTALEHWNYSGNTLPDVESIRHWRDKHST